MAYVCQLREMRGDLANETLGLLEEFQRRIIVHADNPQMIQNLRDDSNGKISEVSPQLWERVIENQRRLLIIVGSKVITSKINLRFKHLLHGNPVIQIAELL